jgi:hypothetical protein
MNLDGPVLYIVYFFTCSKHPHWRILEKQKFADNIGCQSSGSFQTSCGNLSGGFSVKVIIAIMLYNLSSSRRSNELDSEDKVVAVASACTTTDLVEFMDHLEELLSTEYCNSYSSTRDVEQQPL